MKTQTEALKLAQRVIQMLGAPSPLHFSKDEIIKWQECNATIKEVLAQPEQEPHARDAITWTPETGYVFAQPEQEPVAASKKDEVFAASIEFIGTLTGMTPPPIEVAPPEVFKPFRDFTEKVCSILATPPQRKPLTEDEFLKLVEKDYKLCSECFYAFQIKDALVKSSDKQFKPVPWVWKLKTLIEAAHGIKGRE